MTLETASVRPQELPWRDVMKNLQDQVGNQVSIHYASDGSQGIRAGTLTDVKPFQSVKIDDFEIPFIFAPLETSAFMLNMKEGRIESSPAGLMWTFDAPAFNLEKFIGEGAAIQRIMGQDTLYDLPYISEMYDERRPDEIKRLRRFVFRGEDREAEDLGF